MDVEWKKIALYAIVPAVIAGVFSIAPKLYDIATDPKAELTYTTITGPELQGSTGFQRIISVAVENSGKRSLSNVYTSLTMVGGKIEAQKIEQSSGLKPSTAVSPNETTHAIPKLHPGEKFTISALSLAERPGSLPQVAIRSDEVLGVVKAEIAQRGDTIEFVGAALVAFSVFAMAVLFMMRVRKIVSTLPSGGLRADMIFYVLVRLDFPEIMVMVSLDNENKTSFRRLADLLLSYGSRGNEPQRTKAVTALKCLLLYKSMQDDSVVIVVENLKILEDSFFSQEEIDSLRSRANALNGLLEIRAEIDQLIARDGPAISTV